MVTLAHSRFCTGDIAGFRWEMENYLADGKALEKCRAELKMQPERSIQIVDQDVDAFDQLCSVY